MLVLSRKLNQTIMIGEDVRITVVEIREDHVRLGITAPREVPVYREEVYEKIKNEAVLTAPEAGGAADPLAGVARAVPAETMRRRPSA